MIGGKPVQWVMSGPGSCSSFFVFGGTQQLATKSGRANLQRTDYYDRLKKEETKSFLVKKNLTNSLKLHFQHFP